MKRNPRVRIICILLLLEKNFPPLLSLVFEGKGLDLVVFDFSFIAWIIYNEESWIENWLRKGNILQ